MQLLREYILPVIVMIKKKKRVALYDVEFRIASIVIIRDASKLSAHLSFIKLEENAFETDKKASFKGLRLKVLLCCKDQQVLVAFPSY